MFYLKPYWLHFENYCFGLVAQALCPIAVRSTTKTGGYRTKKKQRKRKTQTSQENIGTGLAAGSEKAASPASVKTSIPVRNEEPCRESQLLCYVAREKSVLITQNSIMAHCGLEV